MDLTSADLALGSLARRGASPEALAHADSLRAQLKQLAGAGSKAGSGVMITTDPGLADGETFDAAAAGAALAALAASEAWEGQAAALLAASEALARGAPLNEDTVVLLCDLAEKRLEAKEARLRMCVVALIEQLARRDGRGTWRRFGEPLCEIVDKSFDLDDEERAATYNSLAAQELQRAAEKQISPTALVHETIGWKALETSMRGLEKLVKGFGQGFAEDGRLEWRDAYLVRLVSERALKHENRYVREVGYDLCAAIAAAALGDAGEGARSAHTDALAQAVQRGLEDNWSQVRFAASVAARSLVLGLAPEAREAYMDGLVPRMCLNRYYLAEGVRVYSQETWRLAFPGERGRQVVEQHAAAVVDFYCLQSRADNHGVREAGCHCIAELAAKLDRGALGAHVDTLLGALVECFRDDSWPVRDAACVATGRFVKSFAPEARARLPELFELWFTHLSDNIWSVREDSAVALGDAMQAFPEEGVAKVLEELPGLLAKVREPEENAGCASGEHAPPDPPMVAPSSPRAMAGAESQPRRIVQGSLSELRRDAAADAEHSDQQLFSCGSLAPKLKRRGVGCMDHGYSRPRRNWEVTDGGIYLLRELARFRPAEAEQFMAPLSDVARIARAQPELRVTLWKQLVPIAQALGKRPFKRHLEGLLPEMVRDLSSDSQLVASAAADCVLFLMRFLGPGIFRGRVQALMDGDRLWDCIEASPLVQTQ